MTEAPSRSDRSIYRILGFDRVVEIFDSGQRTFPARPRGKTRSRPACSIESPTTYSRNAGARTAYPTPCGAFSPPTEFSRGAHALSNADPWSRFAATQPPSYFRSPIRSNCGGSIPSGPWRSSVGRSKWGSSTQLRSITACDLRQPPTTSRGTTRRCTASFRAPHTYPCPRHLRFLIVIGRCRRFRRPDMVSREGTALGSHRR